MGYGFVNVSHSYGIINIGAAEDAVGIELHPYINLKIPQHNRKCFSCLIQNNA